MIDLRSDTVTRPTPAMRAAMAAAEVGDDVYGEDPTVNLLEERAASMFGKEAGLFVPTGTMGNTIAIKVHTEHGEEIVCESRSHIFNYELSMAAWFCGCLVRPIDTERGVLDWSRIGPAIRSTSSHYSRTGLIALENTHNMWGGTVYPQPVLDEVCDRAHDIGIPVHLDGARVFNAAAALGTPVRRVCQKVDSVMFCLSKGLGAPVGSMFVGESRAIARGRDYRKRLGGSMRQAGVLAAAGLIALEEMPERLAEDHANARILAEELARIPGIAIDPETVQTNIVIFDIGRTGIDTASFSSRLKECGVIANGVSPTRMRMLTHFDVTREQCLQAVDVVRTVAAGSATSTKTVPAASYA